MPFKAGQGYNGPRVDEADGEAEVLEETLVVVVELLVALEEETLAVDVAPVVDEMDPLVVYV